MERFLPGTPFQACVKCGAGGDRGEHGVRYTGTALEVNCWRCGASLGSYLPLDAPEPRKRPSSHAATSVSPPRGDVDPAMANPEE